MSVYPEKFNDLSAFAISEREPQWFSMGQTVPEGASTADMLDAAKLSGWNVDLVPLETSGRFHREMFETVRTNPFDGQRDTLGIVGARYRVFQNEELFAFGDNLLHGGEWVAAGSIKNGAVAFGVMRLNEGLTLGNNDENDRYLLLHTSHDGSSTISASIITMRIRCTNALNMAMKGAKQSFKIRHSQSADGRVQEAREVLGLANVYFDAFSAEMNKLIDAEISIREAEEIVRRVYPEPDIESAAAHTRWENKFDQIFSIYNGETLENLHGTRYGLVNAMTERLDWYRYSRGGNVENLFAAYSGFDTAINNEKNKILEAVAL